MEDLLKRARSAGVGVFLATQNPGDFDYKCKENVRTWLIGRVKEPRAIDKLKPMLAAAKGDVTDKLAGQATGEFYLVRESSVSAVRSDELNHGIAGANRDSIACTRIGGCRRSSMNRETLAQLPRVVNRFSGWEPFGFRRTIRLKRSVPRSDSFGFNSV
jgi:hypothetical protein